MDESITQSQDIFETTVKGLKLILKIIFLTSFLACEPPVTFDKPQPIGQANLSKFPKRLRGQYLSLADNSILFIQDKLIQRIYDYDYKIHPNELDSNSILLGDSLINIRTNEKVLIKRVGDSLVNHIHYIDTVFQINQDNILRKFKGYYFLNIRSDSGNWVVEKMSLSRGQLNISLILSEIDIDKLKEITESKDDTIPPYNFSVTKKQFKQFIQSDGFSESESFVRQKKNAQ